MARPTQCLAALRAPAAASTRITPGRGPEDLNKLSFAEKLAFAWSVFFPAKEADHARNDAKKRLRMILVADRCALSPQSMNDMKAEIVRVVSEFVVVDSGETVDVNMTNDEENGTIYSVAIPVKRIKPAVRAHPLGPCRARSVLRQRLATLGTADAARLCARSLRARSWRRRRSGKKVPETTEGVVPP